jgi:glycerol kinase
MAARVYVLALDQGTTSSRAILFDEARRPVAVGQRRLSPHYPVPGWVEHDPEQIWATQWGAVEDCLQRARVSVRELAAIGITNQRETAILWDRASGQAVHPAVGWQCRRTADVCDALREAGHEPLVRERTGLVLDPYFSATKIAWILDRVPGLRARAERGDIAFGTVDSWLIYRLTSGRQHVTDASNASRTALFNIHTQSWDADLLNLFRVPAAILPTVVDSAGVAAHTDPVWFGQPVAISGIAGDQQAALFGQGCLAPGMAKNTYGTGSFLLMHTGDQPVSSRHGLLTTVAWKIGGQPEFALEGAIFVTGAVVEWLQDGLGVIQEASETEALAWSVADTAGVYLVPAFAGLGAPYWDPYARGTVVGLTRGSTRAHLVRAALEAMAFQSRDVLDAMSRDSGQPVTRLRVDGGAIRNNFLAQFQADILGVPVERPPVTETTAQGAAGLAGLGIGLWPDREAFLANWEAAAAFAPQMTADRREELYAGWHRAVERARAWAAP